MGVFDDKKFDELDWVSQAIEPIDSNMNIVLSQLPDTLTIDVPFLKDSYKSADSWSLNFSVSTIVRHLLKMLNNNPRLSFKESSVLATCFNFELSGENLILDFENEQIKGGTISLVKICTTIEEKTLQSILGYNGIQECKNIGFVVGHKLSRINEILEILGKCEEKTKSLRSKRVVFLNRLDDIFKNNEWKIKDTELANKVGFWIADYINNGNLAAFSNLCRLKVMTHKEQAIYSIEEVV